MTAKKTNPGKAGRKSKFDPAYIEQVVKLCKLGATDREIADFFGVSEQTLNTWKKQYPEFLESLKRGKLEADAYVADRLFARATGYEHPDVHITAHQGKVIETKITKHYPPDTGAAIFWLKNRRPDVWRDKVETENVTAVINSGLPRYDQKVVNALLERTAEIIDLGRPRAELGQLKRRASLPH